MIKNPIQFGLVILGAYSVYKALFPALPKANVSVQGSGWNIGVPVGETWRYTREMLDNLENSPDVDMMDNLNYPGLP